MEATKHIPLALGGTFDPACKLLDGVKTYFVNVNPSPFEKRFKIVFD